MEEPHTLLMGGNLCKHRGDQHRNLSANLNSNYGLSAGHLKHICLFSLCVYVYAHAEVRG